MKIYAKVKKYLLSVIPLLTMHGITPPMASTHTLHKIALIFTQKYYCMYKPVLFFFFLLPLLTKAQQPINHTTIDIVRDSFGVPHIFAPTDAGAAYGLAWANAEDDFKTIQLSYLAGKKMLGLYSGKKGAMIDYVVHLIRAEEMVSEHYATAISPAFKAVLQGYCDGLNRYAQTHRGEVLVKKLFPVTPQLVLTYSMLQLFVSCGGDGVLRQVIGGQAAAISFLKPGGSNAYAFNAQKTDDGSAFLNINAHQPLNGPVSWYEAHLHSGEGWNIVGALFPGAPTILLGCNENLGWGHTVNYPDKMDLYQLNTNSNNKLQYRFDGHWETLEEKTIRLRVKVAGIPIGVKRKIYYSKYGPAIFAKNGCFAIRSTSFFSIAALEEWYRMNKARNFSEFKQALQMEAIPGYNVVYADRFDTIYYLSNGKMPLRNKGYNWRGTLPGDTSATLWTAFHPLQELPQLLNPASGYLFNSNHSPFNASAAADNIRAADYDPTMGYETHDNNRSIRFMELIAREPKVSYATFKRIKFDRQLPTPLAYPIGSDTLFLLKPGDYPDIADIISALQQWDRKAETNSRGAAYFSILFYFVVQQASGEWAGVTQLNTAQVVAACRHIKAYCLEHFNTENITLGDYQFHVRGDKAIPLPGLPDVIASMESEPYKDGRVKGRQGESYIELVRFTKQGPEIESINCYGASNRPGNAHYADQMEMFTAQKMKKMSLKKEEVYREAERVYHPE